MELKLTTKNETEKRVLEYLQANASEALAAKINAGTKTLAMAMSYAKEEARKIAKGESCLYVDPETVYGWIIHYFEEEGIAQSSEADEDDSPAASVAQTKPATARVTSKPQVVAVKDQKSAFADLLS